MKTVQATEIIRRSTQGALQPFFIRDTEDDIYVVKGVNGAGGQALTSEIVSAELARRMELPIADYALMTIPDALITWSEIEGVQDLKGGPAFASKQVPNCRELEYSDIHDIDAKLQCRLLLFDAWIGNEDRKLSNMGGNPNLLISDQEELVIIDHNLAFNPMHIPVDIQGHVFEKQRVVFDDIETQASIEQELDKILSSWSIITNLIPDEWVYRDSDYNDPFNPTLDARLSWLQRFHDGKLWSNL